MQGYRQAFNVDRQRRFSGLDLEALSGLTYKNLLGRSTLVANCYHLSLAKVCEHLAKLYDKKAPKDEAQARSFVMDASGLTKRLTGLPPLPQKKKSVQDK